MRLKTTFLLFAVLTGVFSVPVFAADTLFVAWETTPGNATVNINILQSTIAGDTNASGDPIPNRVYKLQYGGFYHITAPIQNEASRPLIIVGQTESEAKAADLPFGPAIIQRRAAEGGSSPGTMFESFGDLTLMNVWVMGQDYDGVRSTYEPIKLLGDGKRYVFNNVVFDRNDWHHLGPDGPNNDFIITNCKFRNIYGITQVWEGLGVRFEVGADTVIIENNTFMNIGFTPFQSESAPVNYLRFNHNTLVNIGRAFQAGALWISTFVTNNLVVNGFWHGEDSAQYVNPNRTDPYSGFFQIATIPPSYGTNEGRKVLYANNSFWRDQVFENFYSSFSPVVRSQPVINDTTQGWFDQYPDNMKFMSNYTNANPSLTTYPVDAAHADSMIKHITNLYNGNAAGVARYDYDPGRPAQAYLNKWPIPENFAYTNATLLTGGTDGLPVGDLNWFPTAKATFLASYDANIAAIHNKVSAPVIEQVAKLEAELGTLAGDATVEAPDGFIYFKMDGSGWFKWTFDLPAAGQYDLNIQTHMRNQDTRGQHTEINGTRIHDAAWGWGELIYSNAATAPNGANPNAGMPINAWTWVKVTSAMLITADQPALQNFLATGNTIEISPSWGYQNFAQIDLLTPGTSTVVKSLKAVDAEYDGVEVLAEGIPWVPSAFKSVNMGSGGSVTMNVNVPAAGEHFLRIFFAAGASVNVEVQANSTVVIPSLALADTGDVVTTRFNLNAGANTVKITAQGDVNLDYVQVLSYTSTTGVEVGQTVPYSYSLRQNFPNPFNPATTIQFSLAKASNVSLNVYNILGQKVATLINNQRMDAGPQTFNFNARNLASGIYLYRLEAGGFVSSKKMLLLK